MMKLTIPDMSCGHCRAVVERVVAAQGGQAVVDLDSRSVAVTGVADSAALLAALKAEGYEASVAA
ncbi:heavy-metal-associated domain-containing protein [Paracoccus sp. p4-l81]|uniref:heavy-metal-associated domain-containing protein n=1 Tax=unclassified Paracoccus (in: a-proteobacteria) TaxID=2688777 RepID=UPI0035BA04F7